MNIALDHQGLVGLACLLEDEYVERNAFGDPVWETVPISNLAVHPANLGGSYTQGLACKSLIENVLRTGFSKEEADSKGVAVRAKPPKMWGHGYEDFLTYNLKHLSLIHI